MVLIGCYHGVFEGNHYARCIFTEPFTKAGSHGLNAITCKMSVEAYQKLEPEIELYLNQRVLASYDRFGKVIAIRLEDD